jgi:ABC-type transport system substrate-binding protein
MSTRKTTRAILAILLTLALAFSVTPLTVFAEDATDPTEASTEAATTEPTTEDPTEETTEAATEPVTDPPSEPTTAATDPATPTDAALAGDEIITFADGSGVFGYYVAITLEKGVAVTLDELKDMIKVASNSGEFVPIVLELDLNGLDCANPHPPQRRRLL